MKKKFYYLSFIFSFILLLSLFACNSINNSENVVETELEIQDTENNISINNNELDISNISSEIVNKNIDTTVYLDYQKGIDENKYKWILSDDSKYYTLAYIDENGNPVKSSETKINVGANNAESIDMPGGLRQLMNNNKEVYQGVYINGNITNLNYQTMLVYSPAEYFNVDENGNVISINYDNSVNGYTANTAPIIFLNECGGWKSSSPRSCEDSYIEQGFIYVTCGARSRDAYSEDGSFHTGKAPTQIADLKSGVIQLRANTNIIPGDKNKIVSVGTSGGGQMSSILGVSGDMPEYYPYMFETGTLGVVKNDDGSYSSKYSDAIFAAQNYCPIADIENADIAYAWWWVDLVDDGGIYNGSITEFEKRLQELEANEFINYLNSLNIKDENGNILTLTGLREGTYYEKILENISNALNKFVENNEINVEDTYGDYSSWLNKDDNEKYSVTSLKEFMIGTGLVNKRNKPIPGFDAKDKSAENDAFGKPEQESVHFSKIIAKILNDNYEELSKLNGFDKEQVDSYISDALNGENAEYIENQTKLLNATHILLGLDGLKAVNPVKHFRNRSGTADQHTSFSVGYNILMAAKSIGIDVDYSLVWNMEHGSNEGSSTGTFIDWVNSISK